MEKFYISERFFTNDELISFEKRFNYKIKEISYMSSEGEIDFNNVNGKSFLLKYGVPIILARFGY